MTEKEALEEVQYYIDPVDDDILEAFNVLKTKIEHKNKAIKEVRKMAEAIEKCSLEPDKVYIYAGHIKQEAKQVLED